MPTLYAQLILYDQIEQEEDEDYEDHGLSCLCERCVQDHPERLIFLPDEE